MKIFLFLIIVILLCTILYVSFLINKFFIHKIVKNKYLSFIISTFPIILLCLLLNYVNTFVIICHIIIFYWLIILFNKLIKKKFSPTILFTISLVITTIYLGIGLYNNLHVQETHYVIETKKTIGQDRFRIIQISDAHIGTTFNGNGFKKHMEKIKEINCDIVVITGDLVDDDTKKIDMQESIRSLNLLKPKYGIYFIYGNHDPGYFNYRDFDEKDLINELNKNNIQILRDETININDYITLIGRDDKSNKNRKSIIELTKDLDQKKYLIDLNHQPNDYENEKDKVDLVLSGHTHGGQLFPLGYFGVLTKSNDEFKDIHKRGNTIFIINSGISDWSILFKTGTKSEIGIIDIIEK